MMSSNKISVPGEAHMAFGMAAFVGLGGLLGAYRGSPKSAVFSTLYAVGYAISGDAIRRGEGEYGHGAGALLGSFLTVSMGFRFASTRKVFPAAVIGLAAGLSAGYHSFKFYQWKF